MPNDPIYDVLVKWGTDLVNDAKAEISKVVKYESGQEPDLLNKIKFRILKSPQGYSFQFTMNDFGSVWPYWKDIEFGRKAGKKGVPISALEKGFFANHNMSPSKIMKEMRLKANAKSKLKANFEKDRKALAFIIQRSIKEKGIKPRPFFDRIVTKERMENLKTMLVPVLKKEYAMQIKNELLK